MHHINRFKIDLHDPHCVITLYNIDRPEGVPTLVLDTETDKRLTMDLIMVLDTETGTNVKKHFGTFRCKQAMYKSRIQNQYLQLNRKP